MNGIDRRSQKVRCVVDFEIVDRNMVPYPFPMPIVDQVYTVTDFRKTALQPVPGILDDIEPGITLLEIPSLRVRGEIYGWPICAFRPVDDRQVDIAALFGVKVPELA